MLKVGDKVKIINTSGNRIISPFLGLTTFITGVRGRYTSYYSINIDNTYSHYRESGFEKVR